MADRDPILFEHTVRNLLLSLGLKFREEPRLPFDFYVVDAQERRTALEVKVGRIRQDEIRRLAAAASEHADLLDQFVLATPQIPTERLGGIFRESFGDLGFTTNWITANDLPVYLGADFTIDLDLATTAAQLQTAALVSGIARYRQEHIGDIGWPRYGGLQQWLLQVGSRGPDLPRGYEALARHLSFAALEPLAGRDATSIDEVLSLGKRVDDVTVVLSDLKNFSSLVKAARLTKLQETMGKYYERSRRLVWSHRGTFDKFIGDAVLAFFGYPRPDEYACANAVRFAMDLIATGSSVLSDLSSKMNDIIPTGTRVGIATGEIWVLNTGKDAVELAFIGDVINLAARLEQHSDVDGVLIDNVTRNLVADVDGDFLARLNPSLTTLTPAEAKGQMHPIRAWQISRETVEAETSIDKGAAA